MRQRILLATLVAGTLDLLAAFYFSWQGGWTPTRVLLFVASGPFGDGVLGDTRFAALGVAVHYAIMACMVTVYMLLAQRIRFLVRHPFLSGVAYGLALWFVMYWLVRPLRWENLQPSSDPKAIASQLFCHLILVGLPIAYIAARRKRA